jgi:ABC-type protease/lipase transport system fused ATPase/permease subunit
MIITWFLGNRLMKALKAQGVCDDKRYNFIIEALQGIHSIKSYGIEAVFQRRYERLEEDSSLTNYNASLVSTEGYTFGVLFNEVMIIAVVSVGAPMVINGDFTTGGLIATVLLSGRLMQPIQKALFLWTQFQDYRLAEIKQLHFYLNLSSFLVLMIDLMSLQCLRILFYQRFYRNICSLSHCFTGCNIFLIYTKLDSVFQPLILARRNFSS